MLSLVVALAMHVESWPQKTVEREVEQAIAAAGPSRDQLQEAVIKTMGRLLGERPSVGYYEFTHPIGWPSATIFTIREYSEFLLIHRVGRHMRVELVPKGPFHTEPSGYRPFLFAYSNGTLVEFRRYGGSGIGLSGSVFRRTANGWPNTEILFQHGELSAQFGPMEQHIRSRNPAVVDLEFSDHYMFERYFGGSHFAPALKYWEHWRFADGRLRRIGLRRIETPSGILYDLKYTALHRMRASFDRRVPRRFREALWNVLSDPAEQSLGGVRKGDEMDDHDEVPNLVIGHKLFVHFVKRRGHWRIAQLRTQPDDRW
ncbi:MAG TPA: hypothetical protein VKT78_12240 [Fimbriimonadaceae bacterium]|nr:hypothetical protein [Fimbriimonadaceae bacterium]